MSESKLKVTDMSIKLIKPYGKNPRINDAAVDAVVQSITAFGWRQPIVVDGDGVIIVGHTRWKAAQKMGLTSVPVHVADGLTPEQAKAYRLADNRSGEFAEWDFSLLAEEIDGIGAELQVQIDALDFDGLLEGAPPALPEEGLTDADASGAYAEQYGVIVVCKSEEHQRQVYERLMADGHNVKVVTT
jgi:hypothetical protein